MIYSNSTTLCTFYVRWLYQRHGCLSFPQRPFPLRQVPSMWFTAAMYHGCLKPLLKVGGASPDIKSFEFEAEAEAEAEAGSDGGHGPWQLASSTTPSEGPRNRPASARDRSGTL